MIPLYVLQRAAYKFEFNKLLFKTLYFKYKAFYFPYFASKVLGKRGEVLDINAEGNVEVVLTVKREKTVIIFHPDALEIIAPSGKGLEIMTGRYLHIITLILVLTHCLSILNKHLSKAHSAAGLNQLSSPNVLGKCVVRTELFV